MREEAEQKKRGEREREEEGGEGEREREREGKTNLFKALLEMVGDGIVCGEEDGEVLRLLHGEGIHITAVQDTLSSACKTDTIGHAQLWVMQAHYERILEQTLNGAKMPYIAVWVQSGRVWVCMCVCTCTCACKCVHVHVLMDE